MVSEPFKSAVKAALDLVAAVPDDAVVYMLDHIPVFLDAEATPEQAAAAGCPTCSYLGLWADQWPGYQHERNGTIWLFEKGIMSLPGSTVDNVYDVVVHEFSHALDRDHVLDDMEAAKAGGKPRGCGCPGT